MNPGQIVLKLSLLFPLLPLFTPLLPPFRELIPGEPRGLLICFFMLSQQYMLKFSACYEFVPGLYEF